LTDSITKVTKELATDFTDLLSRNGKKSVENAQQEVKIGGK